MQLARPSSIPSSAAVEEHHRLPAPTAAVQHHNPSAALNVAAAEDPGLLRASSAAAEHNDPLAGAAAATKRHHRFWVGASEAEHYDRLAVAAAQAYAAGVRPDIFASSRVRNSLAYKRLGYRTLATYANEELGIGARTFRRMAALGRKLATLPQTRQAYLAGEVTRTKAEAIARVAGPEDEARWLELARRNSVRSLNDIVRQLRGVRA
ncbi:MAG: hypothetical protein ACE5HV_11655 [Acidobacteriota bacterium]